MAQVPTYLCPLLFLDPRAQAVQPTWRGPAAKAWKMFIRYAGLGRWRTSGETEWECSAGEESSECSRFSGDMAGNKDPSAVWGNGKRRNRHEINAERATFRLVVRIWWFVPEPRWFNRTQSIAHPVHCGASDLTFVIACDHLLCFDFHNFNRLSQKAIAMKIRQEEL